MNINQAREHIYVYTTLLEGVSEGGGGGFVMTSLCDVVNNIDTIQCYVP